MGDTELMACTERKLQGPLDKIEGEKKKKKKQEGQMSNCMTVYGCHKKKKCKL